MMCDKKELKRQRENEHKRRRYAEDPEYREKVLAVNRKRYAEDEEFRSGVKQRSCRGAKKNLEQRKQKLKSDLTLREQQRDRQLRVKYGMTIADYDRMLQRQHGVCAICERKPGRKRLCVDHCHVVNRARGLLCTTCNTGLGQFRDDPVLMRKGAAYLEAWRKAMGLDAAEDRAQLAFDFGPCDEPKRVPPKRIPPKRTAPAPVESGANSLPQCCPAVPSSRRVGHGVGWVERGHDIAAPAVSFVPRDTHHLDRGKLVDDGYRPNRSRENARSHSASKTRVNALMGSTHPTPWRDAGQQRSVDAPPKLGVGTRGEQRHRPGVGVMGRVGDELIVLDHLFLLMPTHDAGEVVEDVSRMFSKRDPLSRALRDPYRGLNAGDRALQDDRCAAAARPASDVST